MVGICNGPAARDDSSAVDPTGRLLADSVLAPAGSPVWRAATSAATVRAPAPAPMTEVTGAPRRRPLSGLPIAEPLSLGTPSAAILGCPATHRPRIGRRVGERT